MFENTRGEIIEDARHVTAKRIMPPIVRQGFVPDRTKPGVLGTGVYFDIGSTESGIEPARQKYPDEELVVFYAKIHAGNVLNMDNPETWNEFRNFQQYLNQTMGKEEAASLRMGGQIDLFIQTLISSGQTFHTVSRTFRSDRITRIAVLEPERIEIIKVTDLEGREIQWLPKNN